MREPADCDSVVTAHTGNEDRIVFTETGNSEAWIVTDVTVAVER